MHILFLHGALASKSQYDELIKVLPNKYNTHTLNFSGHGGSMIPITGLNFETFCQNILDYLNENKIAKINLFGYSMGGYAGLLFASKYPDRVEKIFTLNVKFKWDVESTMKETSFLNPEKMMEKVPFFANNLMLQHGMNMWKDLLHQTSTMMHNLTLNTVLEKEDFEKINNSCLLAVGDKDTTSSVPETMEIHSWLPQAQLLIIPNTPHPFEKISVERLKFEIINFFGG
jgi:pimeloyl-ACP methyl ester carboxylesterase